MIAHPFLEAQPDTCQCGQPRSMHADGDPYAADAARADMETLYRDSLSRLGDPVAANTDAAIRWLFPGVRK